MTKSGFQRWMIGGALLAAIWIAGCGWWFHEDLAVSHAPGAPRPQLVAVCRLRPMVYGADESQSRPGLADAVTIGCEDGLDLSGVTMVAPIRVAAAMADAHVAFPDPTNAASIATRVHADAVIVGSVNFFKFSIAVDVRLVRAETGTIDASAHVEGNKDLKILGRDACKALFSSTGAPSHVHQSRDLPASPVLNL